MTHKQFAITIAKKAGKVIRRNFGMGMKKQWKENDTPVTVTDLQINKMVIEGVKKYFSKHDVLGEEESHRPNNSKFLWVCDPVDGTIPFSHGIPTCVFSLALVYDGSPILGVVYDPFMDRMWFAEKGKGAFLNNKKIKVNKNNLKNSVVNWESSSSYLVVKQNPKVIFVRLSCFIYGCMLVASGELAAAFYPWQYPHDGATAKIIVEEAGGKVTDKIGNDQSYDKKINGCLVSNGKVHKDLLKITKRIDTWKKTEKIKF